MKHFFWVVGIGVALLGSAPAWAVPAITATGLNGNLVVNPSFEDQVISGLSIGVQGWSGPGILATYNVDFGSVSFQPNSGDQWAEIDEPSMSQTILGTVAGQRYDITYYAANPTLRPIVAFPDSVTFGGVALTGGTQTTSATASFYDRFTFRNVLAPSNDSVLSFTIGPTTFVFLDDVSVTATPEISPAGSTTLLLFMLGTLALASGRRRQQA